MAHRDPIRDVALAAVAHGGRVLVRVRRGDPGLGEVWELPGGAREEGESSAAAAARETREETGLAVRPGRLVLAMCHAYPDRRVALHVHACDPVGDPRTARGRWLTIDEIRKRPIPAANAPILDAVERWLARRGG